MTRAARGFVLVNALVIVAALSVVALALLTRAEQGRTQMLASVQAVQLELYLDAYEAFAQSVLNGDRDVADHLGEGWAREGAALPLDRGDVSGRMRDLQAGFNLNWLTDTQNTDVQEAFDRLLVSVGVSVNVGAQIRAALAQGGLEPGAVRRPNVLEDLPGGAILTLDQVPLSERARLRLSPYIAALPGGSQLNVNTTSALVLSSFLPGVNQAALDTLLRTRALRPFASVDDFRRRFIEEIGSEPLEALNLDRLSVGSTWFELRVTAALDGQQATRLAVLRRFALPAGAQVAYRLDKW